MELIEMQATFGCLDGAVLRPAPGLDVLCLPNGAGKSTWTAFLVAMFYGVDASERKSRDRLPVKTRYLPWSGKPMAGTVHLRHGGREIVLQRTSEGGKPMGTFRAYDPATGRAIEGLTGETCGKYFFGVEKAVFLRTGILSGEALAVTPDRALEQHLQNLAATGRESDSGQAAAQTLRRYKNRCRYHQSGRIPQVEAQLRETEAALSQVQTLRRERLQTAEALAEAEETWRVEKTRAEAARTARAEAVSRLETEARQAAAAAGDCPPWETLLRLRAELDACAGEPASLPPALDGLGLEEILPAAHRALEALRKPLPRPWRQGLLAAVCAALGAALLALHWMAAGLAALALAVGAAVWGALALGRRRRETARRRQLLARWQVPAPEALMQKAVACRDSLTGAWQREVLLEELRAYFPQVASVEQGAAAVEEALSRLREAQAAREKLQAAQSQPMIEAAGDGAAQLAALRTKLEVCRAREADLGGFDTLEARRQALEAERARLLHHERALALALEALETAAAALADAYGPRLSAPAGAYLQCLTAGQWDSLVLQEDGALQLREAKSGLLRPLAALSRGTQDQAWLALRLALASLLLPPDAPLILDDALLTFDRGRTRAALELLRRLKRQVLLFTCRQLEESQ